MRTRKLCIGLVAEVAPENAAAGVELRPGLFVKASIQGITRSDITAIPFQAFRDLDTVVVVDPDNRIQLRDVEVVRREGDTVYIGDGLQETDKICLTELPDLIAGRKVRLQDEVPASDPAQEPEEELTNIAPTSES